MPCEKKNRIIAVLSGINILLWCAVGPYGLSQLASFKQQVLDLSLKTPSFGQQRSQAASALRVRLQKQLDNARVDVEKLQTSHQEFNQMWVSLATKVLRKDNIINR